MKKIIAVFAAVIIMTSSSQVFAAANVAALMYHSVTSDEARWSDYTVSPDMLAADIEIFKANGYIPMTAAELASEDMSAIDGKKILLLTFDDGYSNFYTDVFPVLKRYDAKATMYIIGSYVNRYGYLTSDEINEMAHSGLVEIGNHTNAIHQTPKALLEGIYTNPNSFYDVLTDIQNSADIIKNVTGITPVSLSWPYGYYTSELDGAVKNSLGYTISFSTDYGVNRFTGNSSVPLKRMNRESSASSQEVFERADKMFR